MPPIDLLGFWWDGAGVYLIERWRELGLAGFVLLALPMLLLDAPRALVASTVLLGLRALGLPRGDHGLQQAFIATRPRVSVVVAAYNEAGSLAATIDSLLELRWPGLQIVVVDDHSGDGTYERARPYADRGEITLVRNSSASGRGGKPAAINLGLRFATGDFLVLIDADSSFDRNLLLHLIGPFHDQRVGAVAGNIKVRNPRASFWTRMQAIEYLLVIGLNKRWLDLLRMNYIASGACGAYRRTALAPFMGCDVETAEDLDNSLKVRRDGWQLRFAPLAVCMTDVPETLPQLARQRVRWDRDLVRVALRKHAFALDPWRSGWRLALELNFQLLCAVGLTYLYVGYVVFLALADPPLLLLMLAISWLLCLALTAVSFVAAVVLGERRREEAWYALMLPFYPLYIDVVGRWVRTWANTIELLRLDQEDAYLPQSAWRNSPRW
jgi:cellulose synthase/poly-beta-1,6-N-acetylglucosamine synthase-like glycosyltransferase